MNTMNHLVDPTPEAAQRLRVDFGPHRIWLSGRVPAVQVRRPKTIAPVALSTVVDASESWDVAAEAVSLSEELGTTD